MPEPPGSAALAAPLLLENARWFTQVRWAVSAAFIAAGMIGWLIPEALHSLALSVPFVWLLALAGVLAAANLVFLAVGRSLTRNPSRAAVDALLWSQIGLDLVVVTLLVHALGSTRTFTPFVYLFHITLACIFFPKKRSFLVTLAAAALYLLTVASELAGMWPSQVRGGGAILPPMSPTVAMIVAVSAVFIWWVVWYLVSTLSDAVRRRDVLLSDANEQLAAAGREQDRHVLMTVHELKVPFAEIESHIDTLKVRYGTSLPPAVAEVLKRIDLKAQLLRERINEILLLGNLKSRGVAPVQETLGPVDVAALIDTVLKGLDQKARERCVQFDVRVPAIVMPGNAEQLGILFTNLVLNAILYSTEGGTVEIEAREEADAVRVLVTDHGIGIRDDALPHIFEEFYRTKEGARFNRMSTGLGLSIVKEIARLYGFRITVTSEQGKGTTFDVSMPKPRG